MSYIICRNCKKYFKVDETQPLNFDKCNHCGHLMEFAPNDMELKMILDGVVIPEVSYQKICLSCNSLNPRETGACLHCGSTNLRLQYDFDFNDAENVVQEGVPTKTIIIKAGNGSPQNSIIFRLFSLLIGLIDFFLFSFIGLQFILGDSEIPSDLMLFATQHLYSLMAVICVALILAGMMSVMIIPSMSYKNSLEISSTVGILVGLLPLFTSANILTVIVSMVICSILAGLGGLIGEFIIHKIVKRANP